MGRAVDRRSLSGLLDWLRVYEGVVFVEHVSKRRSALYKEIERASGPWVAQ